MKRRGMLVCFLGWALTQCAHSHVTTAVQQLAPAPRNPDLSAAAERYYDQIVSGHRAIAYEMLSPECRVRVPRAAFESLYDGLEDAQVDARQVGDRVVIAELTGVARGAQQARAAHERIVYMWNGQEWLVDRIERG